MKIDEVRADLAAFADAEDDVLIDESGNILLVRNGQDVSCRLEDRAGHEDPVAVMPDGNRISYGQFLTHELARLDVFANKLLDHRKPVTAFVDGPASLNRVSGVEANGTGMHLLRDECENQLPFASRVCFVTADAGHGKTALLGQYQHATAKEFLDRKSTFLFWHIDLQGRQLLRLSEALMGDLGDMRHTGLWMQGIVRLVQRRHLILGIDGFDELAAEQGGSDALAALTALVEQLEGQGVIVAAARRTFFDAEDYLRRTRALRGATTSPCVFDQLQLEPWAREQSTSFLSHVSHDGATFPSASDTYDEILTALGHEPDHPMLTRPFLLSQVSRAMLLFNVPASRFVQTASNLHSGVEAVVEAFVSREVTEKWAYADTGEPYLSSAQHMELLAQVAEEMYRSQKDRMAVDTIQTILTVLLDQWHVDHSRRAQVVGMVKSHVLLVEPADGDARYRTFDHPEFRDYFIAQALTRYLESALAVGECRGLARMLSYAPLSDATARYVGGMVERTPERVERAVLALTGQVQSEWRPSHLHTNVATLIAFLIADTTFDPPLQVEASLIYTSVVFEEKKLDGITFKGGTFVNASLRGCSWRNVVVDGCLIDELTVDHQTAMFENVQLVNSPVGALRTVDGDEEIGREYAPIRIASALERLGLRVDKSYQSQLPTDGDGLPTESEATRAARRFVRMFSRATTVTDQIIEQRFSGPVAQLILSEVIPLMERHELLRALTWKGSGVRRIWALTQDIDVVLGAEGATDTREHEFWVELVATR